MAVGVFVIFKMDAIIRGRHS